MLSLKLIIEKKEYVSQKLLSRGFDVSILNEIILLGNQRSKIMNELENLQFKRNTISSQIGQLKRKNADVSKFLKEVSTLKKLIEKVEEKSRKTNKELHNKMLFIPNIPSENTPVGLGEKQNVLIEEHPLIGRGKVTKNILPHYQIAEILDIIDFKRAVKLSGARFIAYKGLGAKLVRALESFMLDTHIKKGYLEIIPPLIVKSEILEGTGQLPKFADDLFKIEGLNSYLIPTSEVPLTNFYRGEILNLDQPICLTAYTPNFRAEAGSAGRDTKGIIRTHQFNKVELVKIVKKEDVKKEYQKTVKDAKDILELLELPYQEIRLCSGDIGFSAAQTIDLEVWLPSEKRYREVSSISSFSDFQGRRAAIRYKDKDNKNQIAHTINGSGLAIDRVVASLLEVYQNADNSISIPQVLIPYMNIEKIFK